MVKFSLSMNGLNRDEIEQVVREKTNYPVDDILTCDFKRCIYPNLKNNKGYSYLYLPGFRNTIYGHRLSYFLRFGKLPISPDQLDHNCNNRGCCNPHHLVACSQEENIRLRDERGRTAKGEKASKSKLRDSEAIEIRDMAYSGNSLKDIHSLYIDRVGYRAIYDVVRRKTFRNV